MGEGFAPPLAPGAADAADAPPFRFQEEPRGLSAAAALVLGVAGLMVVGVAPVLLGALQDEGRLDASGIGLAAMLELTAMGVSTGLFGAFLAPKRLRSLAVLGCLLLSGADALSAGARGLGFLAIRTLAGAPEGLLIWVAVSMIARTTTPERWASLFFGGQVMAQLCLAALLWLWVLPGAGATGGFRLLAAATLLAIPAAVFTAASYAPLSGGGAAAGAPPPRGWAALLAAAVFVSANGAVSVYLQPLALQAGLSAATARFALVASLTAQLGGAALALMLAGRVRHFTVFSICTAGYLALFTLYGVHPAAWLFIAVTMGTGLLALLVGPYLTPMIIDADPSRRAAMQAAGAQIFGAAAGPLAASFIVSDKEVRTVLIFGCAAVLMGLAGMFALRQTAPR